MDQLIRSLMISELKAQLNSCELEVRVLAREIAYPDTPVLRRNEALMQRARLQTERVGLERQLAHLGIYTFSAQELPELRSSPSFATKYDPARQDPPPFR